MAIHVDILGRRALILIRPLTVKVSGYDRLAEALLVHSRFVVTVYLTGKHLTGVRKPFLL